MGKSRKTMVASRVRKRARELEISDYNIYLDMVKSDIKEQTLFIDAITTHETYFYRTPEVWQYLSESFVPNYCREHKQRDLKSMVCGGFYWGGSLHHRYYFVRV